MTQKNFLLPNFRRSYLLILCFFAVRALVANSFAASERPHPTSTWVLNPKNDDWNTAANWTPAQVPDSTSEAAEFGTSAITNIVTTSTTVNSITFQPGASQYTFTGDFTFNAGGVINNSGVEQTFNGTFYFKKFGATAGPLVTFNTTDCFFEKGTNAGSATYINTGRLSFFGGYKSVWYTTAGSATVINSGTISFHKADAGTATITNNGGTTFGADGGLIEFNKNGDASGSTIINNGGAVFGGRGAHVSFGRLSAASASTLIANGGAGPGSGGMILFGENTDGGTARVEVFGNGNLDISREPVTALTIGSLEGDGLVFLGANALTIGANNLNTSFAGTIADEGGLHQGSGGSLTKTGTGTFSLTNTNTYTGGTTLEDGSLFVNNTTGSGTGTGPVQVDAGTLAGTGTVAGPVTVGAGQGSGAILSPGASADAIGVFTSLGPLDFQADGSCAVQLDSTSSTGDQAVGAGLSINTGAQIQITDLGSKTLPAGTSFILIENTASTAIAGRFANLPDGGTITVGSNTFVANYEGGDGNDLSITVAP